MDQSYCKMMINSESDINVAFLQLYLPHNLKKYLQI